MADDSAGNGNNLRGAFVAVTTLFFAWGFITAMIDPLIWSVRAIFQLTRTEALLTQTAFFVSYGVASLPGAVLVARVGYSKSILIALLAMLAGCLFVPFATSVQSYELVLVALFIVGTGITVLQIAANPLAAALGPAPGSHFRLTLSQAFNSLGTVIAPYVGSMIMLHGGVFASDGPAAAAAAGREVSLRSIDKSFLGMAAAIAVLALFILSCSRLIKRTAPPPAPEHDSLLSALQSRWALFGAASIFLYVGAEVTIASLIPNFLHQHDLLDVTLEKGGKILSLYWFGAMVGRFAGSALLSRFRATAVLASAAAIAMFLCLAVSQGSGGVAAGCALAIGLFNSIMFPTIFTLTLERSTASAAATSGLMCTAIIGGAALPALAGQIVDFFGAHNESVGMHVAFLLPMVAYAAISVFAMTAAKARVAAIGQPAGTTAH